MWHYVFRLICEMKSNLFYKMSFQGNIFVFYLIYCKIKLLQKQRKKKRAIITVIPKIFKIKGKKNENLRKT